MRQKVAVACAYLHEPQAILFDEPLTGLDSHGIRTLKASIVDCAAAGAAIIVSSHLLSLVEDLCSDLLILQKGKALFVGPIDEARGGWRSGRRRFARRRFFPGHRRARVLNAGRDRQRCLPPWIRACSCSPGLAFAPAGEK